MFPMPEKHVPITALSIIILPFTNEVVSFGLFPFFTVASVFLLVLFLRRAFIKHALIPLKQDVTRYTFNTFPGSLVFNTVYGRERCTFIDKIAFLFRRYPHYNTYHITEDLLL